MSEIGKAEFSVLLVRNLIESWIPEDPVDSSISLFPTPSNNKDEIEIPELYLNSKKKDAVAEKKLKAIQTQIGINLLKKSEKEEEKQIQEQKGKKMIMIEMITRFRGEKRETEKDECDG